MENYCPKCGSRVTFNEKNNKYTCSNCGHTFYEKNIYLDRKKVNENYYHKKTPLAPSKSHVGVIFIVLGIAVALFVTLNIISRFTIYKDFKVRMIGQYTDVPPAPMYRYFRAPGLREDHTRCRSSLFPGLPRRIRIS